MQIQRNGINMASVTDLENFRKYLSNEIEFEELLLRLNRKQSPTDKMMVGRALHSILENPEEYYVKPIYIFDGIIFEANLIKELLKDKVNAREVKANKLYSKTLVSGVADGLSGLFVIEYKISFNSFDIERYMNSYQWRFYIDMFEAIGAEYVIIVLDNAMQAKDIIRFKLYRYDGLQNDLINLIKDFELFLLNNFGGKNG